MSARMPEERLIWRSDALLIGLLFAAALIPRAALAWRAPALCPDSVLYVELAQRLDAGDMEGGLRELRLNVFPWALVAMRRLGFDWEGGGRLWCVLVASAVVIPLFNWTRRALGRRAAIGACLLYAAHPALIEWSAEVLRDSTFWLLSTCALYWFWRAARSRSVCWSACGGVAWCGACLTRVEGLFLIVPFAIWLYSYGDVAARRALARCAAAAVLVAPLVLIVAHLLLLPGHPRWEGMRTVPMAVAARWTSDSLGSVGLSFEALDAFAQAAGRPRPLGFMERLWVFLRALESGFHPAYAALWLCGVVACHRWWRRSGHAALLALAGIIAAGMWMHLWFTGETSERYALLAALLAMPWVAVGASLCGHWLARQWLGERWRVATSLGVLLAVCALGWGDALTTDYRARRATTEMAAWASTRLGADAVVVGDYRLHRQWAHYGPMEFHPLPPRSEPTVWVREAERRRAAAIVLLAKDVDGDDRWGQRIRAAGYQREVLPARWANGGVAMFCAGRRQVDARNSAIGPESPGAR